MLSYLCATSIVGIADFARNWDEYFPGRPPQFDPRRMLQQDIRGRDLPSWYGSGYAPADMWNPEWREYQKLAVRLAVETGHDGVFFDNPTVHPSGNYSFFAMRAWKRFLERNGIHSRTAEADALRGLTKAHPRLWLRFRTTEAADFLRAMREYGRSLKTGFLLTCNNSLNSWDGFYSQSRTYGYSIPELSAVEDFILIEDMASQPRREKGKYVSYAQNLRMISALRRGKYLNACTLTPGDYTTPPNLMQLAVAECTAHDASYLVWSCWDPAQRSRMERSAAQYHDFLDRNAGLLEKTTPVSDLLLIWPYDRWLDRPDCPSAALAGELSAANVQYDVAVESDVNDSLLSRYPLVAFDRSEGPLNSPTLALLDAYRRGGGKVVPVASGRRNIAAGTNAPFVPFDASHLSLTVRSSPGVRVSARRSGDSFLLHLYNLNVRKTDRYHDSVTPVGPVQVSWTLPRGAGAPVTLTCATPDRDGFTGSLPFRNVSRKGRVRMEFTVPNLRIWSLVVAR